MMGGGDRAESCVGGGCCNIEGGTEWGGGWEVELVGEGLVADVYGSGGVEEGEGVLASTGLGLESRLGVGGLLWGEGSVGGGPVVWSQKAMCHVGEQGIVVCGSLCIDDCCCMRKASIWSFLGLGITYNV